MNDEAHSHEDHICWGGESSTHTPHSLSVSNLSVRYREALALDHIAFQTFCSQRVALVGPNGAGKSTLLKALAGLVRPTQGSILWRGLPLTGSSQEIAYLPQRGDVDWDFPVTVRGLVEMGRYPNLGWWRRYSTHDEEIVQRALETMELLDLEHRQINALSGGQQQRVFIARALAQEAHVLLLDEPFTGLDRNASETLQRLLADLAKEGRLIVASHHDLGSVKTLFDDVLLLHQRQIAFGPVDSVFTPKALEETFGFAAVPLTP